MGNVEDPSMEEPDGDLYKLLRCCACKKKYTETGNKYGQTVTYMQCFRTFVHYLKCCIDLSTCLAGAYVTFLPPHTHIRDHTTSQGSWRDGGTMERRKETDREMTGPKQLYVCMYVCMYVRMFVLFTHRTVLPTYSLSLEACSSSKAERALKKVQKTVRCPG